MDSRVLFVIVFSHFGFVLCSVIASTDEVVSPMRIAQCRSRCLEKFSASDSSHDSCLQGPDCFMKWENCGLCPDLKCPKPNIFLPENFEIFPRDEKQASKYPVVIHNSELSKLWFKQDDKFLLPKAYVCLDVFSPLAYLDPLNSLMSNLFSTLLKDSLNEFSYDASLAGLSWDINNTKHGLQMVVGGYHDKLHILYDKVLERITNFKVDEKRFEIIKETNLRTLQNFEKKEPYLQASFYISTLLCETYWAHDQLLAVFDQVTVEALNEFIPALLRRVHIEGLVYGNVTSEQALSYIKNVESKLSSNGPILNLMPQQLLRDREIQLTNGTHYVYETVNKVFNDSSADTYFQCGVRSTQTNMELELLAQIIHQPCFDTLRTKEQLGYLVWSGCRRSSGVQGLRFLLQSERHPDFINKRIEAFLVDIRKLLSDLTQEEFDTHREALAAILLEKPKNLSQQLQKYWGEITIQQYHFARAEVEVACLRTLTKEQIIQFFDTYFAVDAPNRHQLSVHVVSHADGGAGRIEANKEDVDDNEIREAPVKTPRECIVDVTSFKRTHGLFPLLQPYMDFNQAKSKL